jgi:hypothetical protein
MKDSLLSQITALRNQPLEAMKAKYMEVFGGESPCPNNRIALGRRIAWRLQEIEHGGLSTKVQSRINELIEKYDPVNNKALRPEATPEEKRSRKATKRDHRLPIPGAVITKVYKGRTLEVKVLDTGFEFEGKFYKTLSGIATAITGVQWNGYLFFKP